MREIPNSETVYRPNGQIDCARTMFIATLLVLAEGPPASAELMAQVRASHAAWVKAQEAEEAPLVPLTVYPVVK